MDAEKLIIAKRMRMGPKETRINAKKPRFPEQKINSNENQPKESIFEDQTRETWN